MNHFVDMLTDDRPSINDVKSAYKTSVACFAAIEAAKRQKVISIREME